MSDAILSKLELILANFSTYSINTSLTDIHLVYIDSILDSKTKMIMAVFKRILLISGYQVTTT